MTSWNPRASRPVRLLRQALLLPVLALCMAALPAHAQDDPPDRVARLSLATGMVSFSPAGDDEWTNADVNRPLTQGDKLWTDNAARAELDTGSAALRVDGQTSLNILNLGERVAQFQLAQGTVNLAVRELLQGELVEIDTPNLAVTLRQAGSYRISVDASGATSVAVRSGEAEVTGEGGAYLVKPGQSYRFVGNNLSNYLLSALPAETDFDRWSNERERALTRSASARYVSPVVIGYQELDAYGSWRQDPEYGNVWTPTRVAVDWAPYHDGRWVWVRPWGWTWVDNAPWGFAPSHYGRWVSLRGHWCWVPGPRHVRPVYAPALVAFIGGSGLRVGVGGPGVAWFPLGPRDVYRPPYHSSRGYFTRVNTSNTHINVTQISNHYDHPNPANTVYVNRRVPGAVAALPATAFGQAHGPTRGIMRVSPEVAAQGQVGAPPPVAPPRGAGPGQGGGHRPQPPESVRERPVVTRTPPPAMAWPGAAHRPAPNAPATAAPTTGPAPGPATAAPLVGPVGPVAPAATGPGPAPRQPTAVLQGNPASPAPSADNDRSRRGRPDERERAPQNQVAPQPQPQPPVVGPMAPPPTQAQPQPQPARPRADMPINRPLEAAPPAVRPVEPSPPPVERRGMDRERRNQTDTPQREAPAREAPQQRQPEAQRAPEPQPQPRARVTPPEAPTRSAQPAPAQPAPQQAAPQRPAVQAPAPAPAPARTEPSPRPNPGAERKIEEERRRAQDDKNRS